MWQSLSWDLFPWNKNEKLKLLFPQLQGSNLCRLLLQTAHKKPHLAHGAAKTWTCRNLFSLMSPLERCCFLRRYAKKLIWSRLGCGLCRSTPFVILILIRTLEVYKQTYQGEERQSLFFTFQKCPLSPLRLFIGLLFLKYPAAQGSMCTTPSPLQGRGKHRDRTCIWSIWMQHWMKSTREVN